MLIETSLPKGLQQVNVRSANNRFEGIGASSTALGHQVSNFHPIEYTNKLEGYVFLFLSRYSRGLFAAVVESTLILAHTSVHATRLAAAT